MRDELEAPEQSRAEQRKPKGERRVVRCDRNRKKQTCFLKERGRWNMCLSPHLEH